MKGSGTFFFCICSLAAFPAAIAGTPSDQGTVASFGKRRPEPVSLLGRPLNALSDEADPAQAAKLAEAQEALTAHPDDPDKLIWVGRRLGYLRRMNDAVEVYTAGIEQHPTYAPLYRHRGHRYISLRQFDKAIADLTRAAELIRNKPDVVEPDGLPNARDLPLTTTGFNVWYHVGLAHYLKGDFDSALRAYERTMNFAQRYDDNRVAAMYWTHLTLRRLRRNDEAAQLLEPVTPDMDIIENHAYHRLLLMYKGLIRPEEVLGPEDTGSRDSATTGYGLGAWYLLNSKTEQAAEVFERVVETDQWPAFGFIAAEVELARLRGRVPSDN